VSEYGHYRDLLPHPTAPSSTKRSTLNQEGIIKNAEHRLLGFPTSLLCMCLQCRVVNETYNAEAETRPRRSENASRPYRDRDVRDRDYNPTKLQCYKVSLRTLSAACSCLTHLFHLWKYGCGQSAASSFCQASFPRCASTQSQLVWSSGICCCHQPNCLELTE